MQHDGTCGHCGSTVRPGYNTCVGCQAMWKPNLGVVGGLIMGLGRLVGLVAAFTVVVGLFSMDSSPGKPAHGPVLLAAGVALFAVTYGLNRLAGKTALWGWVR
jgi:hypothetical protein